MSAVIAGLGGAVNQADADPPGGAFAFAAGLRRLDTRLVAAVDNMPATHEPLISDDCGPVFAWLTQSYGLSSFETDVLLIAVAADIHRRYAHAYALLQDDSNRYRPTVDIVLQLLLGAEADDLINRRQLLGGDAALIRNRLVRVVADPRDVEPPDWAHYVIADQQIVDLLVGNNGMDRRLRDWCDVYPISVGPSEPAWNATAIDALCSSLTRSKLVFLHGPTGSGRRDAAYRAACQLGHPLLYGDLNRAPGVPDAFDDAIYCFLREAKLYHAIPYLDGIESLGESTRLAILLRLIATEPDTIMLAGNQRWSPQPPLGVHCVTVGALDFDDRRRCWSAHLGDRVTEADIDTLAHRFSLTAGEIAAAVAASADDTVPELSLAVRGHCGAALAQLAERIQPTATWTDLVVPEDAKASLQEMCAAVSRRQRVLYDWGFDRKLPRGKGVTALFSGPPGTGKTMAAEVVARDLQLDLFRIDLSRVIDKYIGETEKNLSRIFAAAESANAILLFDEAEAITGKRSEVRDAHDRYANVEIAYLLQAMESYNGVAILATNMPHHLDEAFIRRLAFVIHFPFPDEASRLQIWNGVWPKEAPLGPDIDFATLAQRYKLGGGNIKNIALAAAYLADTGPITLRHVHRAVRREYQKMGKLLSEAEIETGCDAT